MKSIDNFLKEVNKTSFDYDKVSGVQCVDLIKKYINDCFGIKIPNGYGNAESYWNEFENKPLLANNFIKIKNTLEFIPEKGDIMVWNKKRGKGVGHVAICTGEGCVVYFYSYDLNWNGEKIVQKVKHDYKNVYGVLRKKGNTNNSNIKEGEKVKLPVLYTGAKDYENVLVEYNKNQFWVSNKCFNRLESYIEGIVCFVQENSVGVAFKYDNIREFQMNIPKSDLKR